MSDVAEQSVPVDDCALLAAGPAAVMHICERQVGTDRLTVTLFLEFVRESRRVGYPFQSSNRVAANNEETRRELLMRNNYLMLIPARSGDGAWADAHS